MTKPRTTPIDPLAELLATPPNNTHGYACGVHRWVQKNPERADALAAAMESEHSTPRIRTAIGNAISESTLDHHRRGRCSCFQVEGRWARGKRGVTR